MKTDLRGLFLAFVAGTLLSLVSAATNGVSDVQMAYAYPTVWATVDSLRLKTFVTTETDFVIFDQMYNNPAGDPKLRMGVCLQSDDYPDPLTESCGRINTRGATSREAELKSLKIKLDSTAPLGKWRGRHDIILIKAPWDSSRIRNAVAYELISGVDGFVGIGVAYVHLYVNAQDFGLYQVVEDLNEEYLVNHSLDRYGTLLKADDFEWRPPKSGYEPGKNNPLNLEWLDAKVGNDTQKWYEEILLISSLLLQATENTDCVAAEAVIKQYIDVESLTTFIALNTIFLDYDVLNHNFLIYKPSAAGGKWSHLFWDKDQGLDFQRQADEIVAYTTHPLGDTYRFGVMFEMVMTYNNLYISFLRVKGHFERVKSKVAELTATGGPLSATRFTAVIRKYATLVRPFVSLGYAESVDIQKFDAEIARLLATYENPSSLFAEFEEKFWASNNQSIPICEAWAVGATPSNTSMAVVTSGNISVDTPTTGSNSNPVDAPILAIAVPKESTSSAASVLATRTYWELMFPLLGFHLYWRCM